MKSYRIEKDSLGPIKVSKDAMYGPQTQRSLQNLEIGIDSLNDKNNFIKKIKFGV